MGRQPAGDEVTGEDGGEKREELIRTEAETGREHPVAAPHDPQQVEELVKTREELRSFRTAFESISRTFDLLFSRGAFGFSALAEVIREFGPQDQAMMFLFWRMFRAWGLGPNQDQLLAVAHQWHQVWFPLFQDMEQLRAEIPETAAIFAPKQMGQALRWELTMQWLLDVARQWMRSRFRRRGVSSHSISEPSMRTKHNFIGGSEREWKGRETVEGGTSLFRR